MPNHGQLASRLGATAAAGLIAVIALGVVFALRSSDSGSNTLPPTWGARCTLKVEPRHGEPLEQATDRALSVLNARATSMLWTRYAFALRGPGTIDAAVQASLCAEDLGELIAPVDVSLVDATSRTVVGALDITGARWDGTRLRLQLTGQAAAAVARERANGLTAIWRHGDQANSLGTFDPATQTVNLGADEAYGRGVAASLVRGGQPSVLTPTTTTTFGTSPELTGPPVDDVPAWIAGTTPAPAPGRLREVVAGEDHTLFATRKRNGPSVTDWVWLGTPAGQDGETPVPCGPSPGEPLLQTCPLPDDPRRVIVGRAAPEVARVDLLLGGKFVQKGRILVQDQRRLRAAFANGWFIGPVTPNGKWSRSLIAYDTAGREIANLRLPAVANALEQR